MLRLTAQICIFALAVILTACTGSIMDRPPGGSGSAGKQCTNYSERQISQTYCEREAAKTCRNYCDSYGCRTTCGGGGYCESYGNRMVTVKICTDYTCTPGLIAAEGGCFTSAQLEDRREWRVGRALRVVAKRWDVPVDSAAAYSYTSSSFRYGYDGLPIDQQLSYEFAQEGCKRGSGAACWTVALYIGKEDNPGYLNLDGTPQGYDPVLSNAYEQKACNLGYGTACVKNATRWLEPVPAFGDMPARPADPDKARTELIKICETGFGFACQRLASFYIGGEFASNAPHQQALKYYQLSCSTPTPAGDLAVAGCMDAARLMFTGAEDLQRDVPGAQKIANQVAAHDPKRTEWDLFLRCVVNGGRFCGMTEDQIDEIPVEEPLDVDVADGEALISAALELQNRKDPTRKERRLAFDYLNQACELGAGSGCKILAEVLWFQDPFQDRSAARAIWDRGCSLGDGISCHMLAKVELYGDPVAFISDLQNGLTNKPLPSFADRAAGISYFDKGCALANVSSCRDAARFVLQTEPPGLERNQRARSYFLRACEFGENSLAADSCVAAALMIYSDTWGLPQDRGAARQIVEDAKRFTTYTDSFFKDSSSLWRDIKAACILAQKGDCD